MTSEPSNNGYQPSMKSKGRRREMPREQDAVGHVTRGDVLDDLGLDEQTALELKLKYQIHVGIVKLVRSSGYSPRDLEKLLDIPQPRVSELLRGKLGTLSVKRLLWYMDRLGGSASLRVQQQTQVA
jgi:predicted XRE-type DNA-binding protein